MANMTGDYERARDMLAEGLYLGGISEKDKAVADARHILGWLQIEGWQLVPPKGA